MTGQQLANKNDSWNFSFFALRMIYHRCWMDTHTSISLPYFQRLRKIYGGEREGCVCCFYYIRKVAESFSAFTGENPRAMQSTKWYALTQLTPYFPNKVTVQRCKNPTRSSSSLFCFVRKKEFRIRKEPFSRAEMLPPPPPPKGKTVAE